MQHCAVVNFNNGEEVLCIVEGPCAVTGMPHRVVLKQTEYNRLLRGERVQDVLPDWPQMEREFLISGTTEQGYKQMHIQTIMTPDSVVDHAMKRYRDWFTDFYEMMESSSFGVQKHPALWRDFASDSIDFGAQYIKSIESDIQTLRSKLPSNNELVIEMNDGIGIIAGVSCRHFCQLNHVLMSVDENGFKNNEVQVQDFKKSIDRVTEMMSDCQKLTMTIENRESFNDNLRVLGVFKQKFDSITRKKLWGLF